MPPIILTPENERVPIKKTDRPVATTIIAGSDSIESKIAAFDDLPTEKKRVDARTLALQKRNQTLLNKKKAEQQAIETERQAIDAAHPMGPTLITPEYEAAEVARKEVQKHNIETRLQLEETKNLKGATPTKIQELLLSLNVNLDVQLTRTDTKNLLATLLTCNERQLDALYCNPDVPIVIKTVIKRLLDDSKVGSMEAINNLWDRIFGKGGLTVEAPTDQGALPGIIPGQPVSREAYVLIRETIIGGK